MRPFSQTEGAVRKKPFKTFYTDGEVGVAFEDKNRFEGKSNYFSYIPTGEPVEDDPAIKM